MKPQADSPEPNRASPLPVVQILLEGVMLPAKHVSTLLRYAGPLFLLLVLGAVSATWGQTQESTEISGGQIALWLFLGLAILAAFVLATVACHRIFILGEDSMKEWRVVWWSSRETRFLGWWIVIGFCSSLVVLPIIMVLPWVVLPIMQSDNTEFGMIGMVWIVTLFTSLMYAYFFGRWSLLLPATAIDDRPTFSWAWSTSRGNGLRLMMIIGLIPIALQFVTDFLPDSQSIVYSILLIAIWLYVGAIEIALLSLSYRELVRHQTTVVEDE